MPPKISLFSLVLLVVAAIDSIRNLPATALFGSSVIFFFILAAIVFLIPLSMLAAELSSRYPDHGGVFHWVRHAFGEKVALFAIWLQWINTMVWYPTILSFIAGTAAYLYDPTLAQSRGFLMAIILIVFWGLTLLNFKGVHVSVKLNAVCAMLGLMIPMTLLIALGIAWMVSDQPLQIQFGVRELFPSLAGAENWVSLIAIMSSFLGMELAGVHVTDIHNPQKNFPKAMGISVVLLLSTMILGALSIAVVIPRGQIHLVDGIMQTFTQFLAAFHLAWLIPILTLLIIVGSIGGMINWLISPAKGLLQAAEYQFLPRYFTQVNRQGVPTRLLIVQAVLVSLFSLLITFTPSINAFYWFLTDLSTELYMIMYVVLFMAALKLGRPKGVGAYQIPKGLRHLVCWLGICGACLTIIVGYFPPTGINVGSALHYALWIGVGNLVLIAPVLLLKRR